MPKPKIELIKTQDGFSLKTAIFEPSTTSPAAGVIQVAHGFGEHVGMYYEIAGFFASNGYICIIHDQRGHGEMPCIPKHKRQKQLGVVKNYDCLLNDIGSIRSEITKRYPTLPVILYGHSMGGNIALNYLLNRSESEYAKVILESPWLRLYKHRPKFMIKTAKIIGTLSKNFAANSNLNVHILTRDKDASEMIAADKIFHTRMSYRLFAQMTDAAEYALEHASKLKIPILLLCGGKDKIICTKAAREFSQKAENNVTYYEDPEGYHMLRYDAEPTQTEILRRILEFLKDI